jgi:hypothetical protein
MGRKSKLKKQRKADANNVNSSQAQKQPKGDIERMTHLGFGEHNRLRSPEVPVDRPEPQL